jgi:putative ABC transport system permease protein
MDPPSNSHFKFDHIISLETDLRSASTNHWTPDCYTYIKLAKKNSIRQVEASIPPFVKKYYNLELGSSTTFDDFKKRGDDINFRFMPLTHIHLDSHQLSELEPNGNRNYVYLLAVIGAFILLMVCINFINLSTARAAIRVKEVGIRKTIGAARNKLIGQ